MQLTDDFVLAGFTAGSGIWTRNEPDDPPSRDYVQLSRTLGVPLTMTVRPYQANASRVAIVGAEHGGMGVLRDNVLTKTDGLVTAERGLMLSIIAADCVPIYLADREAGVIGLLHCGRQAAAGELIHNGIACMAELGAVPARLSLALGPHICPDCYKVGAEVREEFAQSFDAQELERIFRVRNGGLYLDMAAAIRVKAEREGIAPENMRSAAECTCHGSGCYSYRRGDRGLQNLAYMMMR